MTIENNSLKQRTQRAIALQESGCFIVDRRGELPLLTDQSLNELRYSRQFDEHGQYYDYQNAWGCFSCDSEDRYLLILRKGTPPEALLPQPRLALATATLYAGYIAIQSGRNSLELDFRSSGAADWSTLHDINALLRQEAIPLVVWQLEQAPDDIPPIIRIYNDSAMVYATSAVWSLEDQQLVAAQIVSTSAELLKAIKATLANNHAKSYISVKTPDDSAYLKGARRGYTAVANSLSAANADGAVTVLLHPLAGDPQANAGEYFYLIVTQGESLEQKFIERLDLAIPWPLQPTWAEYLLEAGQDAGLVQHLPASGTDFTAALRVSKNESQWRQLIQTGLSRAQLIIP